MTLKNTKTILFASLIVAMILPFSMVDFATAETDKTKFSKTDIDKSFKNSKGYVHVEKKTQQMTVDEKKMLKDGIDKNDIKIMKEWAKLNNKVMKPFMSGDKEGLGAALAEAAVGSFSYLTNSKTTKIGAVDDDVSNVSYITPVGFWDLTACGITYGSTEHADPIHNIGLSGFSTLESAQSTLSGNEYYEVEWPWIDSGDEGKVYAKVNTTGYGDCTNGEFRDENHIYNNSWHYQFELV